MYVVPARLKGKVCGMAALTPTSRTNPAIQDTQIELTIPLGPEMAALWVSSVTCADAS